MSKIKEHLLQNSEQELLYMGKFLDFIYDNMNKTNFTSDELDEMERENSLPSKQEILSNKSIKIANNKNYIPLQGAWKF